MSTLRVVAPRRALPGSRALAGGVLVAVAVVATFATATGATGDHRQTVIVAARDIAPGSRLTPNDLHAVRTQLAPAAASHTLSSPSKLYGAVTLGPLRAGELVQPGGVVAPNAARVQPEVSFALAASRALGGELKPGETVDVLATNKNGGTIAARAAVTDARVIRVDTSGSSGIGHDASITVTLAVPTRDDAAVVAAAVDQDQVTLVRTTGLSATGSPSN